MKSRSEIRINSSFQIKERDWIEGNINGVVWCMDAIEFVKCMRLLANIWSY